MKLNHHHNCKYLFNFNMPSLSPLSTINSFSNKIILLIFIIVTFFSNSNHAQEAVSSAIVDQSTVYSSVNLGTIVQKLLIQNRFLYIGGRNFFLRMDPKTLEIMENFTTGPIADNYKCPPPPSPCPVNEIRTMTQSDCINLFSINVSSSSVLLACYSTHQGMCYVIPQAGFKAARLLGDPNNVRNYVASRRSSYVVSVADELTAAGKQQSAIFVAHAYDDRPLDSSPPTISKRKLVSPINLAYWTDGKATLTARDVRSPYKNSKWPINYIYGFQHGDYVFFVKTEPEKLQETQRVTKIIRICIGDGFFGSYSEIQVTCKDQTVATAATLGKMDDYLRNTFNQIRPLTTSNVLFLAFQNTKLNKPLSHTHSESRVCAFSVDHLMYEFETARNACYARRSGKLIETFVEPGSRCIEHEHQQCQQSVNMLIEVTKIVDGYVLYGDKPKITSMVSLLQGSRSKYSLFIGTENGLVKKIVNGQDIFTIELSKSKIEPDPVVESDEENIFMATGQSLIKLPVKTCSYYKDCGSCIESQAKDNIDCAWTGKSCVVNGPDVVMVSHCEPKLISFSPKKGPTQGGTILRVKGVDLGFHDETSNTENSISIGGKSCSIISWNYTDIECKIVTSSEQPSTPSSGFIELKVKDVSARKGYDIIGTVKSSESFQFVNPSVTSVKPLISPLTGGVNVFILGENLDIGSNLQVLLAGVQCESIEVVESTAIKCVSGSAEKQGYPTKGPIGVIIDSAAISTNFTFSYFIDPLFSYITPNVTSATSAVNITVIGDHFDSLYQPRLIVSAIVPKASISPLLLASDCTLIDVTSFICPSPIMPSEIYFESPITTTISFANGGSSKHIPTDFILVYLPDPKFSDKIVSTPGIGGSRTLEIMGQHLHTGYGMKVILVNQQDGATLECKDLRSIDGNLIACNIPLEDYQGDPTVSPWNISVITGSKQLFVGSVPIGPPLETESSSTIAGIVVGMITALGVILLIMMYILKRNGYLLTSKKGPPSLGVAYRSPENGQFQRQGSQNEYHQAGSRISGQPLLFNRQSEEIKFVLDPEKQSELMADGTLFSRDYLTREKVIGQGNFGLVYQGYLKLPSKQDEKIKVAIKTLKTERGILSQEKGEAFLAEGLIMKEFCHENVLSLVGVSIDFDGSPMIITPFMEHGDLRSFIQQEDLEFTVIELIQFGVQVAQGMVYLAGLKFVHRDLAARNCMVDEHQTVKVADFGLSRDVYTTNYYSDGDNRKPLPRKWMAIESLERGNYDTKSDVWSYGVLLWELLTRGDIPYPDVEDWKMKDYLKVGYRLPRPEHCPPEVYSVMKECWVEDPKSRPTFEEILKLIEVAIESNEKKYLEQKTNRNIRYINDPSMFINPEYDGSMIIRS